MQLLRVVQSDRTPEKTGDAFAEECCAASKALEDRGEYSEAFALFSPFCTSVGEWPQVEGLSNHIQAAVFLRLGVVTGWLGSARAIEGAGQFAVQLTLAAQGMFEALSLTESVGECHLELGWLYWRAGKFDEASYAYRKALSILPDTSKKLKAKAYLRQGIVLRSVHQYQDALALLNQVETFFKELDPDDILRGGFHNERALVIKNLTTPDNREEYLHKALTEYTTALFHIKKCKHRGHCAVLENNIGNVHIQLGQHEKGFAHLERAGKMFKAIGDVRTFAQVEETRAQALIDRQSYAEAERIMGGTIRTLEKAGELSLLCENLITLAIAKARQGKASNAHSNLLRAVTVAAANNDRANGGRAWLVMLEEAENLTLSGEQRKTALIKAAGLLEDSQDFKIQARLLACAVTLATQPVTIQPNNADLEDLQGKTLKEAVRLFKARYIQRAIDAADGNCSAAARSLGMKPQGLHSLLNGTHKNITHEKRKKYSKSYIRPVIDEVAERRARRQPQITISKKPGSIEIQLPTDHLAGIGPRANDWVVAEEGQVREGELAAVQLNNGTAAVGYYRRAGSRVILEVGSMHFTDFDFAENEVDSVLGKVYGWYKTSEEDAQQIRPFI